MKKSLTYLIVLLSFFKGFSQVNDNCINAIPLCTTPSFTFYANSGPGSVVDFSATSNVSNPTNNPFPPNAGCLKSGELNPQWLLITIGNAGLLEFVFGAANSPNPQAGCYDWAMWPYSPTTCADILNNTLPPIRCNWNGTCGGGTGIASATNMAVFGGNSADFEPPLQVNACQQFVICISNFSGVNTLVSFQSLGSASLSCNPNCSPNYTMCFGSTATVTPVNYAALANPSFSIQPGGTVTSTGSFVVSPTVTSTYTTFITGTNASGAVQTLTASSTITVFPQPAAAPTVTNTTCTSTMNAVDLNLTFNPVGTAATYTINWSPIPNGAGPLSPTSFTGGIAPGLYNATITTAHGCTATTSFSVKPTPPPVVIVVNPLGSSHTITCLSGVTLTAMNPAYNYTWSSIVAVFQGPSVAFNSTLTGNWLLTAEDPQTGCVATKTFVVSENVVTPTGQITPILQNITCSIGSIITVTGTANQAVNLTHNILSPFGGTFSAQSQTITYLPGGIGEYTHCVVNDINGCSSCKTFTVTSNLTFPTYNVQSPQNFTLGCGIKAQAQIIIANGNSGSGAPISYTLIGPGTSPVVPPTGTLSGTNIYTVTTPGSWTVITRDNVSFCETRAAFSVLANTFVPDVSADVPRLTLDCYEPKVTLKGQSLTNNVSYVWTFPGTPGNIQGDTIPVKVIETAPTTSMIADYTLTVRDDNNTCTSFTVIPMRQNLYPPKISVSKSTTSLTCKVFAIELTNQSMTSIPPVTGFPYQKPVVAYVWEGPTPQQPVQLKSTYFGAVPGVYTLTGRDINNGCIAQATVALLENRVFPDVNNATPRTFTLDCGAATRTIAPLITGPTTGFTYSWITAPGSTVSSVHNQVLTTNKTGSYRVLVTNPVNGCASLASMDVVNGTLTAQFDLIPAQGYAPLSVSFYNNSTSSLGSTSITAHWNFGNGQDTVSDHNNLLVENIYSMPGTYKITMFATKGNCLDTAYNYVKVDIPSSMEIPNVFTPNGDNVNDLFFLKASNLASISLNIFDRWGKVVYSTESDTGNVEWDGKNQSGKAVAEGSYFYILKATGKDGTPYDKKGTVNLYR